MGEEQRDTLFGLEALKAWAELSAEEREQARKAFRFVAPDMIERPAPLVVLVLDEDLPADTVAIIVAYPGNSDRPMLVFSRRTYSNAAWVMAGHVQNSKKANALLRHFGRLDVTAGAMVVGPDRNVLLELEIPHQSLWATGDLSELSTVATSTESVDVPDLGRGQLYRFSEPPGRK
jgi:hypothetical protein